MTTIQSYQFGKAQTNFLSSSDKINIRTIPKSGTHLIKHIFELLGIKKGKEFNIRHLSVGPKVFQKCSDERVYNYFRGLCNSMPQASEKCVILIRDPRDNIVSLANYFKRGNGNTAKIFKLGEYKAWTESNTVSEVISKIITTDKKDALYPRWYLQHQIYQQAPKYLQNKKKYLVIRFEDLIIDPNNKQSCEKQCKTIKKILKFFDRNNFSDKKIKEALAHSWGETRTFTPVINKIGQWKTTFTTEQIKSFAEDWNQCLLKLGYETDPEWYKPYINEANETNG